MDNQAKKNWTLAGMVCGVLIIIFGVVVLAGGLGEETSYASSLSSSLYESGYASFGGDFYTYACNNSAAAAEAARTTANNVHYLAEFLKLFCGLSMIAFGFFTLCLFGYKYADLKPASVPHEEKGIESTDPDKISDTSSNTDEADGRVDSNDANDKDSTSSDDSAEHDEAEESDND